MRGGRPGAPLCGRKAGVGLLGRCGEGDGVSMGAVGQGSQTHFATRLGWLALLLCGPVAGAADVWKPGLTIAAEERYDDDLLLRTEGGDGGQLMTKLSPQASIKGSARTWELNAAYAADLFVRHGSGSASVDHRVNLDARRRLSERLGLRGEGRLWYVSDPTSLPRMGMARSLVPVLYGIADVGVGWSATQRWLLSLDYRFEGAKIEEVGREPGFLHQGTAQAMFRIDRRTELGVDGRLQRFVLGSQSALAAGPAALLRHRFSRQLTLSMGAGASYYREDLGGPEGWVPRVTGSLDGAIRQVTWGVAAGHDLVGASGFTTALTADFAAATIGWHVLRNVQLRAMGNLFRNGPAPDLRADLSGPGHPTGSLSSQGYGVAAAAEWQVQKAWALQVQFTRIGQVGTVGEATPDLTRNIAALRAVFTPWD